MLYYIHQIPLSSLRAEGESGYKTNCHRNFKKIPVVRLLTKILVSLGKKVLPALEANVISS